MHPRNLHHHRYDLERLIQDTPELRAFVIKNPRNEDSIDFSQKEAVTILNQALLKTHYGIQHWNLPDEFLCPPIPGRADYLHHLADLLEQKKVHRGLDIGTGASCIYPLLGHRLYQWTFKASEINPKAFHHAQKILNDNSLNRTIQLVMQVNPQQIFQNIILPDDQFDFTMCNPPFHASANEAKAANDRKWKKLGQKPQGLNFGGQSTELWCDGGERAFILKMIQESISYKTQCLWFTTLVSKEDNLPALQAALKKAQAKKIQVVNMGQGQKKSRFIAWSFI